MVYSVFFSQLVFRKIITTVANKSQILRRRCTKFYFGWGYAPDPAGGAYTAGFKEGGPTSNRKEGSGKRESKGRGRKEGKGMEGEGKGGKKRGGNVEYHHLLI